MNIDRWNGMLSDYKRDFSLYEGTGEQSKWKAVKWFQDHWDINASDFAAMLQGSLKEADYLLDSKSSLPFKTIVVLAKEFPEEVRQMFRNLYDEAQELYDRYQSFKDSAAELVKKYGKPGDDHFQKEHAISIYLWLRYPDTYSIYKFTEMRKASEALESGYHFEKGEHANLIRNAIAFENEIQQALKPDAEVQGLMRSQLTDDCYPDPELRTLTSDIIFYAGRDYYDKIHSIAARSVGETPEDSKPDMDELSPEQSTLEKSTTADVPAQDSSLELYTKEDFLKEVYFSEEKYDSLVSRLENKKNLILQGAPGVGKTFAARRLAWSMMGVKDDSHIEFIQFHQNYTYEDFMMGYRPSDDGFKLRTGVFYNFCKKAEMNPSRDYFFIIDEINRGNLSKIFGELLMLIEKDYRGQEISLAYNGETFSVPKNLYLIGMMNTADRSLAMIDYALRRRFSFANIEPAFESAGFKAYCSSLANSTFDNLIKKVEELNRAIASDRSLGDGFRIGHSYFCGQSTCTKEWMRSVVEYDIIPMLSEYWFDDEEKLRDWKKALRGVF